MPEWLWAAAFAGLLSYLCYPLVRPRHTVIPLAQPIIFVTVSICAVNWMLHGWNGINRWVSLLSAVFIGLVLLTQLFGAREWYLFFGGGFIRSGESYEELAETIRQALWLAGLPPASVIFRSDGFIGFSGMSDVEMDALMDEIDSTLKDSRWDKRGPWHYFFGTQYGAVMLMLVVHIILGR